VAEQVARTRERDRLWHARERYRYPDKDSRPTHRSKEEQESVRNAPFIMWDGEGPRDAGYALFGNSAGYEICHPFLGTEECLELIMECEAENPNAIHFWFGGNYDVSMILADMSNRHFSALHANTRVVWKDWEIEHIPHKWLKVKHGQIQATIFDIRSYFAGGFLSALEDFKIGTEEEREHIRKGKAGRESFLWAEIRDIREYWLCELRLGVLLAEELRTVFTDAGYLPRSWHGPGALARMAIRRHHVYDAMANSPIDVRMATQYAFAGGRFELFKAGHVQSQIYNADINSAYPFYATGLPNLSRGRWVRGKDFQPGKFGVYHISYCAKPDAFRPYPLWRRMPNHMVIWPYRTEGWYWTPEAELVANDPDATFIEAWIFEEDDPTDRPFAWLEEYYYRRKKLKNAGSAAEYTLKLIINSVYGQLAQRAGWDRKTKTAPKSHQLEWAGYITSACRAAVYKVASAAGEKLISIDTDGVASLAPLDIEPSRTGAALGQWELTEYQEGIFWQSGIYTLKTGEKWVKAKTRGIPKGTYEAEALLECLRTNEPLRLRKKMFVTYGLADNGRLSERNTWISVPHEFAMGGAGKRMHWGRACKHVCTGDIHKLGADLMEQGPDGDCMSIRHHLPWQDPTDKLKAAMDDEMFFVLDQLDSDDAWVRDYT
jgi:DNA polymerase type B, organellar and viral